MKQKQQIKDFKMNYTKQDLLDYLCDETENQYVLFSTFLKPTHPDFVLRICEDEIDDNDLSIIIKNENRILVKQREKTNSDFIYKIFQKKTNILRKGKLDKELIEYLKPADLSPDEEDLDLIPIDEEY